MFLVKHCARGNYALPFEMLISRTASALPARAANPLMPGCYLCWHSSQTAGGSPPHPSSAYRTGQGREDAQRCDKKCLHAVSGEGDAASPPAAPGSPLPPAVALMATGHCRNLAQEKTSPKDRGCDAAASGKRGTGSNPSIIFLLWEGK